VLPVPEFIFDDDEPHATRKAAKPMNAMEAMILNE